MGRYEDALARRREKILTRIDAALARSDRNRSQIKVMAVSKTVGLDEVLAAVGVGYRLFGENRPQELVRKTDGLRGRVDPAMVRFDMIGNLQRNKINAVLGRVEMIQSISSLALATAVSDRVRRQMAAGALDAPQPVLLEVNVSGEATKAGFSCEEMRASVEALQALCGIRIEGLMTMAPQGAPAAARAAFKGLRDLRDELVESHPGLRLPELSCGMSEDFEIALEEGSTLVRLGRVVFDPAFELE